MRIGFDAKRAFNNYTGLGNYSRNLLQGLAASFPHNSYILYASKANEGLFKVEAPPFTVAGPLSAVEKLMPAWWRTHALTSQLITDKIDLYHGLSHELPLGIEKSGVRSIVTIHDLIFLRYPRLYKATDRITYSLKFRHACQAANRIVAVSSQTASDITTYFGIAPEKIEVVYQCFNPVYLSQVSEAEKEEVRLRFRLPETFVLYVGTIEARKNLLTLVKAHHRCGTRLPMVVVGKKCDYFKEVADYIRKNQLNHIHFIESIRNEELPALYQMARLFVYPSLFEGFGIPIIEALASRVPVITTKGGCFAEAGGPASLYVDPLDVDELAEGIVNILADESLQQAMSDKGFDHALQFTPEKFAAATMDVYQKVMQG